ncbi:uncharacterized protein EV420DRAFT_1502628 [Desarmillaria tabescens]|uniref:Snurportin-1 n=1 Tax=Armillaria tabescens TaxID=1929756 RepID=A0AA39T6L0_ARMTA|nr:uncharacterized protein EV420DRAFT_1502628 [Desarmillaria tabescens]KAK0468056.1 hypothetical protein EV420DRAFT_1502628 [Desarmillaria tabescens]
MSINARKISFKLPPTTITDKLHSQQARRSKALEEQKRRRAERIDASRQLDSFADLSLGLDDEDEDDHTEVVREGVGAFAAMLESEPQPITTAPSVASSPQSEQTKKKNKRKRKARTKQQDQQQKQSKKHDEPNEWADKCMYAELLEMNSEDPWTATDGLPDDLETGWVAVAPVPVGKRCLAISLNSNGTAPNTILRSRVLGKPLMARFPSPLPPNTVLDCILDRSWRENGILHVLDVIKWKGQDIGDCETPFRFWWRDTRLAELPVSHPPAASRYQSGSVPSEYRFSYPTTLLPIPYHQNTSLANLSAVVLPLARSSRSVTVDIPVLAPADISMDIDGAVEGPSIVRLPIDIYPDGMLLYVSEASYESGTSPLSSWVPIKSFNPGSELPLFNAEAPLDKFQRLVYQRMERKTVTTSIEVEMS